MKIAVMGTGAIGGYLGARLAVAGAEVTFIARGAHLAAIRDAGLRMLSPLGDVDVRPASATEDPATVGKVPGPFRHAGNELLPVGGIAELET